MVGILTNLPSMYSSNSSFFKQNTIQFDVDERLGIKQKYFSSVMFMCNYVGAMGDLTYE